MDIYIYENMYLLIFFEETAGRPLVAYIYICVCVCVCERIFTELQGHMPKEKRKKVLKKLITKPRI
jgi:hypothetical protein